LRSTAFNLQTPEGRRSYLEYVYRQDSGETDEELHVRTAKIKLLNFASQLVHEWFMESGLALGMSSEDYTNERGRLIQLLLQTTAYKSIERMEAARNKAVAAQKNA